MSNTINQNLKQQYINQWDTNKHNIKLTQPFEYSGFAVENYRVVFKNYFEGAIDFTKVRLKHKDMEGFKMGDLHPQVPTGKAWL